MVKRKRAAEQNNDLQNTTQKTKQTVVFIQFVSMVWFGAKRHFNNISVISW
jgi:hypothetical protein